VQALVYRPATGVRAFPDGGIPRYVEDYNLIGLVEPDHLKPRILHRVENSEWQHGQGQLNVHSFLGGVAVVSESGQRRDTYLTEVRYHVLETASGRVAELPLKKELQAKGRGVGYFYLLDGAGTLLFVTPPAGAAKVETPTNEMWLRTRSGAYLLVAKGVDLYKRSPVELVYWEMAARALWAYDVKARIARRIDKYVPASESRPETGVRMSTDGKALELWRRRSDSWEFQQTLLTVDQAKRP
jgi:hypothetical protein